MPSLKLKPGKRPRVLSGHPWVFQGEVQRLLPAEFDGQTVECRDHRGHFLGTGLYTSRSNIVWRRFTREKGDLNRAALAELIRGAVERRKKEPVCRLVWSESDNLPGLVVDQYGDKLVVQTLTLGMEQRLDDIIEILKELLKPSAIVLRNDVPSRKLEGLEETVSVVYGAEPAPEWMRIGEVEFQIDLLRGQKTGFYLDQREQYTRVARYAKDQTVLDAFCNQGGFALHAARAGARAVTGIDASQDALEACRRNAEHNKLNAEWIGANVFDFFREQKGRTWDLIILDPPPFARSKQKLTDARRGYKELNLRAMQSLPTGGVLATYVCSHHMKWELFEETLWEAAADARRDVRVRERCSQPADHPVWLNMPESEYLKGFILEIC